MKSFSPPLSYILCIDSSEKKNTLKAISEHIDKNNFDNLILKRLKSFQLKKVKKIICSLFKRYQ